MTDTAAGGGQGGAPRSRVALEAAIIAGIVALDQLTKYFVRAEIPIHGSIPVVPGVFNLVHVRNTGAAFGFLNAVDFPYKTAVVALIATAALIGIALYAARMSSHERLARICHCDYDRETTLIALLNDAESEEERVVGACRISKLHGVNEARFSLLISDLYQRSGIGRGLLRKMIEVAKAEKISRLTTLTTVDNTRRREVLDELGFQSTETGDGKMVKAELALS